MTLIAEEARDAVVLLAEDNPAEQNLARRAGTGSGARLCDGMQFIHQQARGHPRLR